MMRVGNLPSGSTQGAMVEGLVIADLRSGAVRDELMRLWLEAGLVLFRGEVDTALQVAVSEVFGALEHHPVKEVRVEGRPELIEVGYTPGVDAVVAVDGQQLGSWIPWHTDLIYRAKVNHGGILRSVVLPTSGGRTGFIDKALTWDSLPDELKQRIAGRDVVYKMRIQYDRQPFAWPGEIRVVHVGPAMAGIMAREDTDFPECVHPAVFVHPQSGRTILNVSPMFALRIVDMDPAESDDLLRSVTSHIFREQFAYFHEWTAQDMVLWDNWRMLHRAMGVDPSIPRVMQRTTIAGDYRDAA